MRKLPDKQMGNTKLISSLEGEANPEVNTRRSFSAQKPLEEEWREEELSTQHCRSGNERAWISEEDRSQWDSK